MDTDMLVIVTIFMYIYYFPPGIVDLKRFPCFQRLLNHLTLSVSARCRLFQKRLVCTKFYIYVFMLIKTPPFNVVSYYNFTWVHSCFLIGVRVNRFLVLCICFADRCLSFYPFSFGHCVFCPSSMYE